MPSYKEYISAISDYFKNLETSPEFSDYADFQKKYFDFSDFYDKEFGDTENPEYEKILEDLGNQFQEKRAGLLKLFAEQAKDIPGLTENGELLEQVKSFVLTQVDNNLQIKPPRPLVPGSNKIKKFYYPIYKNKAQQTNSHTGGKMEEKKITQVMRESLNILGMDDEAINALKYDEALSILRDKSEILARLDHVADTQKITQKMRESLNALGMDDESINALSFNDALGILRDKEEISQKLDDLSTALNKKDEKEELRPTEGENPTAVPTHENLHWIDEKAQDYEKMKETGNTAIKTITPDKEAGTFTAEVDNATVTYSSPNDVTVSKGANYSVFDTMMKEPSNAGKAVRIPEDASEEFKTNLFVAAVLNGHKVNGAEDLTLDAATLAKIGLTDEQKAQLKAALPNKPKEEIQEEKNPKPQEEKPSEKVVEAIAKLEEPKAKLAELVETGKVSATISSNMETKKSEIAFNFDATKGGTQADADEANRLLTEALKSVDMLRQKTLPADKDAAHQTAIDNYAIKSAQLGLIRSVYQPEQSETVKAMDRIRAKKLGLIDEEVRKKDGTTVQTLEGNNRNNYETKLSPAILKRVQATHEVK